MNLIERMKEAPVHGGFQMDGYWVWCGSVIKGEDGFYHMFASRWPKHLPMHPGWLLESEVVRAVCEKPEGPYVFKEVVLGNRGAAYWDGRSCHNPQIRKHGDTYLLYYTGITHPFEDVSEGEEITLKDKRVISARSNKRIGLATSNSVLGPWKRMDKPILETRPDKFDSFLTSNPAPCIDEDGSVTLIYKARKYIGNDHSKYMTFGVAKAKRFDADYIPVLDQPLFSEHELGKENFDVEDPFVWKQKGVYHMIAKDMNGNICGEKHAGIYADSVDGIHWKLHEGAKSYSRKVLWDDGVTRVMGSLERPNILFEDGEPSFMFFATADGSGGFTNAANTWNMVIPLERKVLP